MSIPGTAPLLAMPPLPLAGPYLVALTHPSWANENLGAVHYQRLEFLGDALIKGYVAELLFRSFPGEDEGQLSDRLHQVVSRTGLAKAARGLGLDDRAGLGAHVRLGRSEQQANPAGLSDKILEELFEAWVGATFLVDGDAAARALVHEAAHAVGLSPLARTNHKDTLQRHVQRHANLLPTYTVDREAGSRDHEARWIATAAVPTAEGAPWKQAMHATAAGRSKMLAEQAAAQALLCALGLDADTAADSSAVDGPAVDPAPRWVAAEPAGGGADPDAPQALRPLKSARVLLKERADRGEGPLPVYTVAEQGSPQRRFFVCTCRCGEQVGVGEGVNKRSAQESAAAMVWAALGADAAPA